MKFKIVGKIIPLQRVVTGLHSFDWAFTNPRNAVGFPIRGMVEIAGPTGCGKTTFILGLSGLLGKAQSKNIVFADIEGFDSELMTTILENSGFDGEIALVSQKTDEEALDEIIVQIAEKDCSVAIFDSIGAISPISEIEGDLGEANMGRRAKLLSQFSRKLVHITKDEPHKTVLMTNHLHPKMGGRGVYSPGGETLKYIAPISIRVKRAYYKNKIELFPDGSYILEGKVEKNRFGFEDRIFYIVILGGIGIHIGLTAMYDCIQLGIAERGRGNKITMNDVTYGNFQSIFGKAREGDNEFFQPFVDALKGNVPTLKDKKEDVDDTNTEPDDSE